jgi:HPt (histidine-containing phosphotransfer) domain-containing protein
MTSPRGAASDGRNSTTRFPEEPQRENPSLREICKTLVTLPGHILIIFRGHQRPKEVPLNNDACLNHPLSSVSGVLDRTKIQELLDLDKESAASVFSRLVGLFEESAPRRLHEMRRALGKKDLKILEREAHTLKSSAATLGAFKVQMGSQELEDLASNEHDQGASHLIDALELQVNQAISELRQFIDDKHRR